MGRRRKKSDAPFSSGLQGLQRLVLPQTTQKSLPAASPPAAAQAPGDDAAAFAEAMRGVEPLVEGGTPRQARPLGAAAPRQAAAAQDLMALADLQQAGSSAAPFVGPDRQEGERGVTWGCAAGVTDVLMKQLRQGAFAARRQLDLHGMDLFKAQRALLPFLRTARQDGERCVLVVTGRGTHSVAGVGVLRDALPDWLAGSTLRRHVLAFCTALPRDGGDGAFYVLLRRGS